MSQTTRLELQLPETILLEAFRRLPIWQRTELLEKLRTLSEPSLRTVPAHKTRALVGLVSLGGDAVADAEALYDGSDSN